MRISEDVLLPRAPPLSAHINPFRISIFLAVGLGSCGSGGGILKKRVGLYGRGKRGGARTLVATNKGNRWIFVYGFEKNDRANISDGELEALKDIAAELLARTVKQLDEALND